MTSLTGFATPSLNPGTLALELQELTDEQKTKATAVVKSWAPDDHADILDMLGLAK